MQNASNYREILRDILVQRMEVNPRYSMRAFGKQLGISHVALSQIFKGKKNLSYDRALEIATKLKMTEPDKEYFCTSVLFETVKNPETKTSLMERLNRIKPQNGASDLSLDLFRVIADWYHFAILSLLNTKIDQQPKSMAQRLGISVVEVEGALERLQRLEMIELNRDGKFKRVKSRFLASSETPSSALRKFHKQMLEKAIVALSEQKPEEKIVASETFAFNPKKIKEAKAMTEEYLSKIISLSREKIEDSTDVYHLQVNCFNLTKSEKGKV